MSYRKIVLVLFATIGACLIATACTYELPMESAGGNGGNGGEGMAGATVTGGNGGAGGLGGSGSAGAGGGTPVDWWDAAWKDRVRITFKNMGGKTLNDFPVMVRLDGSRVPNLQTSLMGADLRFIDDDGHTVLPHEIDRWEPSGNSFVWVRVPTIDATDTDHIWLYYNNKVETDVQDAKGVWDGFIGVYHLSPSPIMPVQFANSAGSMPGTWANDEAGTIVSGQIGDAIGLDGAKFLDIGDNGPVAANKDQALTIEAWVNTVQLQDQEIVYQEGNCVGWSLGMTGGNYRGRFLTATAEPHCDNDTEQLVTATASLKAWHYLTLVIDRPAGEMRLYFNGVFTSTASIDNTDIADGNGRFRIGSDHDGGPGTFNGSIDEVRISNSARSANWIAAQHKSMTDAFLSFKVE